MNGNNLLEHGWVKKKEIPINSDESAEVSELV